MTGTEDFVYDGFRWQIEELASSPLRYGQLREQLGGITDASPTRVLRDMERNGLVGSGVAKVVASTSEVRKYWKRTEKIGVTRRDWKARRFPKFCKKLF